MYLKRLELINIESHKDSILNFVEGVNVIVGDSDSGKSAILRALQLLLYNQPVGDDFRSDWGGDSEIRGKFEDGDVIRKRTSSLNAYYLDGAELTGIGRGKVPGAVKRFLQVSEINLMSQEDPLFMVQWDPKKRGEVINSLCDFSKIETATTFIKRQIKSEKAELKKHESNVKDLTAKIEALPDIDELEDQVSLLEGMVETLDSLEEEIDDIEADLNQLNRKSAQIAKYEAILKNEDTVTNLLEKAAQIDALSDEINDLESDLDDIATRRNEIKEYDAWIVDLEKEFHDKCPGVCPLCGGTTGY